MDNSFKIDHINYIEICIPLESEETIQTNDKWVDKFKYILCSLKKQTDNSLSGLMRRFESRIILSIIINYGININHISKYSAKAKKTYI